MTWYCPANSLDKANSKIQKCDISDRYLRCRVESCSWKVSAGSREPPTRVKWGPPTNLSQGRSKWSKVKAKVKEAKKLHPMSANPDVNKKQNRCKTTYQLVRVRVARRKSSRSKNLPPKEGTEEPQRQQRMKSHQSPLVPRILEAAQTRRSQLVLLQGVGQHRSKSSVRSQQVRGNTPISSQVPQSTCSWK